MGLIGADHRSEPLFYSINLCGWFRKKTERNICLFFYSPSTAASREDLASPPVLVSSQWINDINMQIRHHFEGSLPTVAATIRADTPFTSPSESQSVFMCQRRSYQHVFFCLISLFDAFQGCADSITDACNSQWAGAPISTGCNGLLRCGPAC